MTTRRIWIPVLAAVGVAALIVVAAVTVVVRSTPAWRDAVDERASERLEQVLDRLERQAADGRGVRAAVSEVTPFRWDRLHTFDSGTSGLAIRRRSGQRVIPDGDRYTSGGLLPWRKRGQLLVFTDNGRLARVLVLEPWRLTDADDGQKTGRTWTTRATITDTEPTDPLALVESPTSRG